MNVPRWLLALAAVALLAPAACKDKAAELAPPESRSARASSPKGDPEAPVDPQLLAYLSQARALHHEANVHEASNDPARAIAALEQLTKAARPRPGAVVPEIDEVLADTYARLAELRMRAGNFDGAARDVEQGLAHAKEPTYFRGHLFEVAGIVEEARAVSLADAGRPADVTRARERALTHLREAVEIQNRVIQGDVPRPASTP
ncbi:hypothetical protein [Pendulispora albinea]|uniref:Tetratricopeptide repeat protein n=1 Tax=Pendulispora albinea TaxID=2741071 RepID=A0ABZ2LKL8_9BACT